MKNILYIIAVLLIIAWAYAVFVLQLSGLIHCLFVIAILAILFRVLLSEKPLYADKYHNKDWYQKHKKDLE